MNFKIVLLINRLALFVVYFWFGILKVIDVSPAKTLVFDLAQVTLPFIPSNQFIIAFGIFECIIGILWLYQRFSGVAFWLTIFHLFTTFLPTIFLPKVAWGDFLTPSLIGQYIIKNLVILASILTLYFAFQNRESKGFTN